MLLGQSTQWYNSPTFLVWIAIAFTVIVGALSIWATFRSARQKRAIYFSSNTLTPVLVVPEALRNIVEVRHRGKAVNNPYIVTVQIAVKSKHDITKENFYDENPIEIDLGVDIIAVLSQRFGRPQGPPPLTSTNKSIISLGPGLLKRDQVLTFTILTEGEPGKLKVDCQLIDVDTKIGDPANYPRPYTWAFGASAVTGLTLFIIGLKSRNPPFAVEVFEYCAADENRTITGGQTCASVIEEMQKYDSQLTLTTFGMILFMGSILIYGAIDIFKDMALDRRSRA